MKTAISIRKEAQEQREKWAEEKASLEIQYKSLLEEQIELKLENSQMHKDIKTKEKNIQLLNNKKKKILHLEEGLLPYLDAALLKMSEMVDNSVDFLLTERMERLEKLKLTLSDEAITTSEKYRKFMEALFIETEYGITVEVYRRRIKVSDKEILADVFRLGRLSIFCLSLDEKIAGYFNPGSEKWEVLPKKYNREIKKAIAMGTKRQSVELLVLPLGRLAVP